jgi:hypothetical protein
VSNGIDNAISFAHALTKHLLHVPEEDAQHILIAVLPRGDAWKVRVSYAGFFLEQEAMTLDDAIGAVVGSLTARVAHQLEEGSKLLGKT